MWSRPFGLLLATAICMVHSLPSTTRYTSFEGYDRFSLPASENPPLNLSQLITSPHFSDSFSNLNHANDTSRARTAKQPNNEEFYNDLLGGGLEESRKRKRKPSKDQDLYTNFIKNTLGNLFETTAPAKTHKIISTSSKKNSSVVLNTKNTIKVVPTKAPLKLTTNKVRATSKSKVAYKTTTIAPLLIKLTKPTTAKPKITTAQNHAVTSTSKPKPKPTVHKILTKWSDSSDLGVLKQNWYEDGVPYPNPNPEISSFSPPVSLSDVSSLSPPSFEEGGLPGLNPEISSFSPPVSLNELSSITPLDSGTSGDPIFPSPNPEVISYSPPYSISDVPPLLQDAPAETPVSDDTNPVSVFNLDMRPEMTKQAAGSGVGGSPCPTVHISSSVLAPRQMTECSDLNLVINSHFHQNQNGGAGGGTRNPALSTYDAAQDAPVDPVPVEEEGQALADPGLGGSPGTPNSGGTAGLADTGGGGTPQAVAPQAGSGGTPGGGTGGSGGDGGDGDDGGGGLQFPDLKHFFEACEYLWNKLGNLLSFLRNPYLYIIPMALFFTLGFFTVIALFPWWIPLLLLYLGVKTNKKPKETVAFYKHVHKPVHHPDGWFWNHQTKTWQNVQEFVHKRSDDHVDKRADGIEEMINKLKIKYEGSKQDVQTWKRRKRSK
ncbi:hypothetical protein NQ315_007708 [Exocentrus adspersus]|uniref:Uncharacterized protein n=1 Tax=Exocentrus adspersus TaxID=1586481 RepID=A0AAV8WA62_9CUCU|nr:hypothetical protein NQ315_007708 [Exocentrus adspersus]